MLCKVFSLAYKLRMEMRGWEIRSYFRITVKESRSLRVGAMLAISIRFNVNLRYSEPCFPVFAISLIHTDIFFTNLRVRYRLCTLVLEFWGTTCRACVSSFNYKKPLHGSRIHVGCKSTVGLILQLLYISTCTCRNIQYIYVQRSSKRQLTYILASHLEFRAFSRRCYS